MSSTSKDIAVAIMAKAPRPGTVKTRLCPPLLATEAAALYRCFLLDKIAAVAALVDAQPVIAYTPDDARAEFDGLAPGFSLVAQHGPDLGARLHATLACLLAAGHAGAIAVDSDTPDDLERLRTTLDTGNTTAACQTRRFLASWRR